MKFCSTALHSSFFRKVRELVRVIKYAFEAGLDVETFELLCVAGHHHEPLQINIVESDIEKLSDTVNVNCCSKPPTILIDNVTVEEEYCQVIGSVFLSVIFDQSKYAVDK